MPSERRESSSFCSSTLAFLTCRFTPQKLSLETINSTTMPCDTPSLDWGVASTRASAVSAERKFVSVILLPTSGWFDISNWPPLAFTCLAMACSLIARPAGPRQLTSIGTVTGKRRAFLRSTFVPSGLVPRLAMGARFLPPFPCSPRKQYRSEGSLGQNLTDSSCTKGQYPERV